MALTFSEPKTGRTQQVGENERVRIATLKRLGWKQVKDAPAQSEPAGVVTIAEELTPEKVGDPVLAVTEVAVEDVDPDGDALSLDLDAAEAVHAEGLDEFEAAKNEKPTRKGR